MHSVQIAGQKREIPSCWNELSIGELLLACRLFLTKAPRADFHVKMLHRMLKIKRRLWNKIHPEDMHGLSASVDFLLQRVTLTRAVVPSFRSKRFPWVRYYGPANGMETSTFGEFTRAHVRFEAYRDTQQDAMLDELVAILFRPEKFFWSVRRRFSVSGDRRRRLREREISSRAKRLAGIPPEIKYGVFLFFTGVCGSLPERFPNVYRAKPSSDADRSSSWSTLIIALADGKTDDESLERILFSNMYNVLMGLEQRSIEYFDFIKKYPDHDGR